MKKSDSADYKKVYEFLKKHPMGILSTASGPGTVWGAAIYFLADKDLNIYFVTRAGTFKYENIEAMPFAALTVSDSKSQITVQLSGAVQQMPVNKYMDVFFDKFATIRPEGHFEWAPPIDKIHKGNYMPLQLTPSFLQFADYGERRIEAKGNYIEQIIPRPK